MKKNVSKFLIVCVIMGIALSIFSKTNAAILSMDYNEKEDIKKENNYKLYPGDEVFVSFSVDDTINEKVMAVYGIIKYDKNLIELVKPQDGESDNPTMGNGWLAGSVSEDDNTFFFYTLDESRSNVVGYIKFKVKKELDKPVNTIVSAQDVTLYKKTGLNNYEEISTGRENIELEVKIGNRKTEIRNKFIIVTIATVIIILIICILITGKKTKESNDKTKDEDVEKSQDDNQKNN